MEASGQRAELRVGGRVAARTGTWKLEGTTAGWLFQATSPSTERDDYLLDAAETSGVELRVDVGAKQWRWKGAQLLNHDPATIRGTGRPDIL